MKAATAATPTWIAAWLVALALAVLFAVPAAAAPSGFGDNGESIAVIIGNQTYRNTSPVDYAGNDAEAMKDYLVRGLGFRLRNVILVKDATLNDLNLVLGTENNPQGGRLFRTVTPGRSNVFVYYSGHGVPNANTREPFLLPQDGDPNFAESGYALETLYRNLELVKQKIGADRRVIVMVDACFTGQTGRKGESLLSVSAPGFTPAKPTPPGGVIRLAATSGASPANWDPANKLGLFTSRFLMGAAGLAEPAGAAPGAIDWTDIRAYVNREVEATARRDVGREQKPEIDAAELALPAVEPGQSIRAAVGRARDEELWRTANGGPREALERYVARCVGPCAYRDLAMSRLLKRTRGEEADKDDQRWAEFSAEGKYQAYLDACDKGIGRLCAYRTLALGYLGRDPAQEPKPAASDGRVPVDQIPDRKPGLWNNKKSGFGATVTSKECVGPGSEEAARKMWEPTCPKWQAYKTASGYELEQQCEQGPATSTGKTVVTGDFDKAVRSELEAVISGVPGRGDVAVTMVIDSRRIGACPRGRKPGDVIMPNGQVVQNPQTLPGGLPAQ